MMRRRTKINKMITSMNYSKIRKLFKQLVETEHKLLTSYNDKRLYYEDAAISKIKSDSKYFFRYANEHKKAKKPLVHYILAKMNSPVILKKCVNYYKTNT